MLPSTLLDLVGVYEDALDINICKKLIALTDKIKKPGQSEQSDTGDNLDEINPHNYAAFKRYIPRIYNILNQVREIHFNLKSPERISFSPILEPLHIERYSSNGSNRVSHPTGPINNATASRLFVMLAYLNDVKKGGETVFDYLDAEVKPKAGTVVIFPYMRMYRYADEQPISNAKYVLSTYVRFSYPRIVTA